MLGVCTNCMVDVIPKKGLAGQMPSKSSFGMLMIQDLIFVWNQYCSVQLINEHQEAWVLLQKDFQEVLSFPTQWFNVSFQAESFFLWRLLLLF